MKQYGLYGFFCRGSGLFPGYFLQEGEVSDPEAVLGQLEEGAAPTQHPQGPHKRSPVHPKENRQFFLGHLGVEVELVTVQT